MSESSDRRWAVVIEPRITLAQTVSDALENRGFDVLVSSTHAGAASNARHVTRVDFLIAAVPAPGESHDDAYLAEARATSPLLGVVVMLSDPCEDVSEAPTGAIHLLKPFTRTELETAITKALDTAGPTGS